MKPLLLLLSLIFSISGQTQNFVGNNNALIAKGPKSLKNIRINRAEFRLELSNFLKKATEIPEGFKIINQAERILLLENGSGRVFETTKRFDSLARIDRTKFGGYCYGATAFIYKDTLFSVGGYGFWQLNGIVRYFDNSTREWSIKPTNIEIPFAEGINALTHFDQQKGILYLLYETPIKENIIASKKDVFINYAQLNINTGIWTTEKHQVDKSWGERISDFSDILAAPSGLILNSKKFPVSLYVNLPKREVTEIAGDFVTKRRQLFSSLKNYITFWEGDTLKIYNYEADTLLAVPLYKSKTSKNLLSQDRNLKPFFTKHEYVDFTLVILLILSITHSLLLYFNHKKKSTLLPYNQVDLVTTAVFKTKDFFQLLDQIEKDTLQLIVKNSVNNQRTSIDEINKTLQITNRPYKIQNNIRADVISQINKKYSAFNEIKEELITRRRASFDKRYLEYLINERHLKKIADCISLK